MKKGKKLLSILLTLCLVMGLLPMPAAATEEGGSAGAVTQLTERIQTGGPGTTLTGDKVLIVNAGDTAQSSGTLPAISDEMEPDPVYPNYSSRWNDPVEMAEPGEPLYPVTKTYELGAKERVAGKAGTLRYIGQHCYVWLADEMRNYSEGQATEICQAFGNVFDTASWFFLINASVDTSVEGWRDPIPYRDNSGKLHIILGSNAGSSGYYAPADKAKSSYHISIDTTPPSDFSAAASSVSDLFVHEGQHLLLDHFLPNHPEWMGTGNEGLAVALAMYMRGKTDWMRNLDTSADLRSGQWSVLGTTSNITVRYSYYYLFFRYVITQLAAKNGESFNSGGNQSATFRFFRTLYSKEWDIDKFFAALEIPGLTSFDQAVQGFYLALAAQESSGPYGFYDDPLFYAAFGHFPWYYANEGEQVTIAARAAILIKPADGKFTVPADGGANVTYYAITDKPAAAPDEPEDVTENGTAEKPYIIRTAADMSNMLGSDAHFRLAADIDLGSSYVSSFYGVLDGAGYTIKATSNYVIGYNKGTVKNVRFDISGLSAPNSAIDMNYGVVSDCTLTGSAAFNVSLSGNNSYILKSAALVNVNYGTIQFCTGESDQEWTVTVGAYTGDSAVVAPAQLCGQNNGTITDCRAAGSLKVAGSGGAANVDIDTGGIAARNTGTVSRCFAQTSIVHSAAFSQEVHDYRGSLVGETGSWGRGVLTDCYAYGDAGLPFAGQDNGATVSATRVESFDTGNFTALNFDLVWNEGGNGVPPTLKSEAERLRSVHSVTVDYTDDTIIFGAEVDLSNHARLKLDSSGQVTVPVTNSMVDLNGLYALKAIPENGQVTIPGTYQGNPFTLTLKIRPADLSQRTFEVGVKPTTSYIEEQTFSYSSMTIKDDNRVIYTYGFSVDLEGRPLTTEDTLATVLYCGQAVTTVNITVRAKQPARLTVLRQPKLIYNIGDHLELDDMVLTLSYDNGTRERGTYAEKKEAWDLQLYVTSPGNTAYPNIPWNEAVDWAKSPLQNDTYQNYDQYDLYVFSGRPTDGSAFGTPISEVGRLQVGYVVEYTLTYPDGRVSDNGFIPSYSGVSRDFATDPARLTDRVKLVEVSDVQENGFAGAYTLSKWEQEEIDDENLVVYYTGQYTFTPNITLEVVADLPAGTVFFPDGVFRSSGKDITSRIKSLDAVTTKMETLYTQMQTPQIAMEGTTPVKVQAVSYAETDRVTADGVTRIHYTMKFEKCGDGTSTYILSTSGSTPPSESNNTISASGDNMAAVLESFYKYQNKKLVEDGKLYVSFVKTSGNSLVRTWWKFPDDQPSLPNLLVDWGDDYPFVIESPFNFLRKGTAAGDWTAEELWTYLDSSPSMYSFHEAGDTVNGVKDGVYGKWTFNGYDRTEIEQSAAYNTVTIKGSWTWTPDGEEPETYTVTFNANGGSGSMGEATGISGSYTLPACGFTAPNGQQFKGWATSAGGEVISGDTIEVSGDTTLYAIWEDIPATYTVTYNWGTEAPAGATLPTDSNSYASEDAAKAAVDTGYTASTTVAGEKDGKTGTWSFSGWTATVSGTVVTFTGTWSFTEAEKQVTGLEISGTAAKTEYEYGDAFETAGLTVTAIYSDSSRENVTDQVTAQPLAVGDTEVTLTYGGKSAVYSGITVEKKRLDVSGMSWTVGSFTYDGNEKSVALTGMLPEGVQVEKTGDKATDAGTRTASAAFSLAEGYDEANYEITGTNPLRAEWTISQAAWTAKAAAGSAKYGTTGTVDLTDYLAPGGSFGDVRAEDNEGVLEGDPVLNGKVLSFTFADNAENEDKTAVIAIPVTVDGNYEDYELEVTITVTAKLPQTGFKFAAATQAKTYGDADFTVKAAGAAEGSTVTYESGNTDVAAVDNDGKVQIRKAGTATITATASATEEYAGATASYTLTVEKAVITIKAKNKTAYVGGTAPALGDSDYTVTGLVNGESLKTQPTVAYASEPDMSKTGTVAIQVSGAEAPDGGNYQEIVYTNGTLTISKKSSGSSSGGSGSGGSSAKPTKPAEPVQPVQPVQPAPASFTDVKADAYYYDAVQWATERGITSGKTEDTFAPGAACTRAQIVTFLWRAAGSPAPKSGVNPFADMDPDAYYYNAVLWAVENGITNGAAADIFAPDRTVTRGQTVTFLWRSAGSSTAGSGSAFGDVGADDYYNDAVRWAVENGITNGTTGNTFSPASNCTRGQIVTFLYRYMAE